MNTYPVHPEAVKLFYDVEANFRVQLEFRGEDSKGNWKERVITFIHRRNKGIDKIVGQQLQPESLCYDVMFDQIQELLQKGWSPCVGSLKKLPTEEMERLDPFSSIFSLAPKYSEELEALVDICTEGGDLHGQKVIVFLSCNQETQSNRDDLLFLDNKSEK